MNPSGGMLSRVTNKQVESDVTFRDSGPGLILTLKYPDDMKPSEFLRLVRRAAKRANVNLMTVETAAGVYNHEGDRVKGTGDLPSAVQAIGVDPDGDDPDVAWANLLAFARQWFFYDYGTDNGPALPLNVRPPRFTNGEIRDKATGVRQNVSPRPATSLPATVQKNVRNMLRSKDEREIREERERLNRIHVNNPKSPYHVPGLAKAEKLAAELLDKPGTVFQAVDKPQLILWFMVNVNPPVTRRELWGTDPTEE